MEDNFKTSFANCARCKENKSSEAFNIEERNDNGLQAYCKKCMKEYQREWRKKNPEAGKIRYRKHSTNPDNRIKALLRANTVDRSLLSFKYIKERLEKNNYCCEITGIPFEWEARNPCGLSIDRIDPNKAYTEDNIRLVCWWINAAMGNWGLDKLKELIGLWGRNFG